jgi:hypothetical protein
MLKTALIGLLGLVSSVTLIASAPAAWSSVKTEQVDWHLVKTELNGTQWYLDTSSVETDHSYDHNHHAGYIKTVSPDGGITYLTLGIDCQSGRVRQFSSDGIQHYSTSQSPVIEAIANDICSYR